MLTRFFFTESADSASQYNRRSSYYGGMFATGLFSHLLLLSFRLQKHFPWNPVRGFCAEVRGFDSLFSCSHWKSTAPPHGQLKGRKVLRYESPRDAICVVRSKIHGIQIICMASAKLPLLAAIRSILEDPRISCLSSISARLSLEHSSNGQLQEPK